jgi:hypothetical protein
MITQHNGKLGYQLFWQASGAMVTAHCSHPSSGEVCPEESVIVCLVWFFLGLADETCAIRQRKYRDQ